MFTHAQMCCKIFSTKMEGNKDEAVKCLEFARRFLAKGDREKAKKFILKSKKLYPLEEAESKSCGINIYLRKLQSFQPVYLAQSNQIQSDYPICCLLCLSHLMWLEFLEKVRIIGDFFVILSCMFYYLIV